MNKVKPEVKITLDKERTLKLDLNAMVEFEEVTGKSIFGLQSTEMSAKDLRALLWCMLIHEDESLSLKDVGHLINQGNMETIVQDINTAMTQAIPESKGELDPLPKDPTG